MKKIIGIILIIVSLYLGYTGITTYSNSGKSLKLGKLELSAENQKKQSTAYMYLGLAILAFAGGVFVIKKN